MSSSVLSTEQVLQLQQWSTFRSSEWVCFWLDAAKTEIDPERQYELLEEAQAILLGSTVSILVQEGHVAPMVQWSTVAMERIKPSCM